MFEICLCIMFPFPLLDYTDSSVRPWYQQRVVSFEAHSARHQSLSAAGLLHRLVGVGFYCKDCGNTGKGTSLLSFYSANRKLRDVQAGKDI